MKPVQTDWTIVLAGSWNVAILNPDWLSQNIFKSPDLTIDILVEGARPKIRFTHKKITLIPQVNRITLVCTEPSEEAMSQSEEFAIALLDGLPITPVTAVGINVGFIEDQPEADLLQIFNFKDNPILAESGFKIGTSAVTREIPVDGCTINFRVRQEAEGNVSFYFNCHTQVQSTEAAKAAILKKGIQRLNESLDILDKMYSLKLDD